MRCVSEMRKNKTRFGNSSWIYHEAKNILKKKDSHDSVQTHLLPCAINFALQGAAPGDVCCMILMSAQSHFARVADHELKGGGGGMGRKGEEGWT